MPFPHHDSFWAETVKFLSAHAAPEASLLAPDEFVEVFANVYTYAAPELDPTIRYDWIVIHKGKFETIASAFLETVLKKTPAVFANDVFVVFSSSARLKPLPADTPHVASLRHMAANRKPGATPLSGARQRLRPINITKLDVEGVRQMMNERFSRNEDDAFGGYEHPHHWDRVRYQEVDHVFTRLIGDVSGLDVLEIGCGLGRNARLFKKARSYLGTDLSDVAIEKALRAHPGHPSYRFERMNAMDLTVENDRFDLVLATEIIEHVQDAEKMLREVHRVLKPDGRLLFNSANRDSLHLRMVRALGYPDFLGTSEHFREFGYDEIKGILDGVGFSIVQSEGVFLLPYMSVPGVSPAIQTAAFDDPALVEILRDLGERAGPQYGFEFLIEARKK